MILDLAHDPEGRRLPVVARPALFRRRSIWLPTVWGSLLACVLALVIIGGERDRVVPIAHMEELMRVAQKRGARVLRHPGLAHPFMDASADLHQSRFQAVADFLAR